MPTAAETVRIAREWVERHATQLPGLRAAHLLGSLASYPPGASFPSYRDVDIALVTDAGTKRGANLEAAYRGLIIEGGFYGPDEYRSAEQLLANPALGPHLLGDTVLYDPEGLIGAVQPEVRRAWPERRWVEARCEVEKRDVLQYLALLEQAAAPQDRILWLFFVVITLASLPAVARLRTPTHRRCLVLAREVLAEAGRPDLHEALLGLLGHACHAREQVEAWLPRLAEAFDLGVQLHRTPSWMDYKLRAHVRPIFIEGAREMLDEGMHRETMWWIGSAYFIANAAIQNDGTPEQRRRSQAGFDELFRPLSTDGAEEWRARVARARRVAGEIFAVSDELAARLPATSA